MNIEFVGVPCSGKSTIANHLILENRQYRRAKLRHKLLHIFMKPFLLKELFNHFINLYRSNNDVIKSIIRSVHLMPLPEDRYLVSDEGVVVYSSAVGIDPTNANFSYITRSKSTFYVFIEPSENVLSEQMKKRGRCGLEYNPFESQIKVSFEHRRVCFENWKFYFKKHGIKYISLTDEQIKSTQFATKCIICQS